MSIIKINKELSLVLSHLDHAKDLFDAVESNRGHIGEFLPWVPKMVSVNDFEGYLQKCIEEREEGTESSYNIFRNNKLIGRIGLHQIDQSNKNAMIGYWIIKSEEGKGIITEACHKLINIAFTTLDLHRLEILTAVRNHRSTAIPIRLGFQKEGILREVEKHADQYVDLNIFSLLDSEWKII